MPNPKRRRVRTLAPKLRTSSTTMRGPAKFPPIQLASVCWRHGRDQGWESSLGRRNPAARPVRCRGHGGSTLTMADVRYEARVFEKINGPALLRFGPWRALAPPNCATAFSTPPTQRIAAIWAPNPRDAAKPEGALGRRSRKTHPRIASAAPGRRPASGRPEEASRTAASRRHRAKRTRDQKAENPPLTQASRVEPAARRLLFGSGPARAAATTKEWTTRRRRRRRRGASGRPKCGRSD